jgi:hypothetical protein
MESEKITIDDLARMVQGGFSDMKENMDNFKDEVKKDMDSVKSDIQGLKIGQKQILQKLEGVDKEKIDGIDERVKDLEDLFAVPAKK